MYRYAIAAGNSNTANIRQTVQLPGGAHQQHFIVAVDAVSPRIAIIIFQRGFQVIQIQSVRQQGFGIGYYFKNLDLTPQ